MMAAGGELLDRERELDSLAGAVGAICSGAGSVTVLEGSAGIGKSALLGAVRELADTAGATVLRARCEELESALPWSLARGLLEPALAGMSPQRRRRTLERADGAAAEALAASPELSPETLDQAGVLRRAHALTWVVSDFAAGAPLVVVVDDLHWGDEQSLHFIAYLAARAEQLPVMLVLARRPRPPGGDAGVLERATGHPHSQTLALRPLGRAAVERLVAAGLGGATDPALVAACQEVTGGNPFYLRELLRDLEGVQAEGRDLDAALARAATPARVIRSVCVRLDGLGAQARALAGAASVLGGGAALHHAALLAELGPDEATGALEALAAVEILMREDPLQFVHPLVAAAILEDLGSTQRAELHLRAAKLLAAERAEPIRVGLHLLAGARHGEPWVVETLRDAATRALASGAGELACDYLERALEEPPAGEERVGLLCELGRIEALLGRAEALEHLRSALSLTSAPEERAGCLLELGRALALAGEHEAAARAFEQGADALGDPDCELARELQVGLWLSATVVGGPASVAVPETPEIGGPGHGLTGGQRQLLAALAQQRAFEGGTPSEIRMLAERAWGGGELLRSEGCDGRAWTLVTGALMVADDLEMEFDVCNAVIGEARLHGSPMAYATASYCRAWPLLHRGQVDEAVADLQSALTARADGWGAFVSAAVGVFALACIERGAIQDGRAAADPALADPALRGSGEYVLLVWGHARLLLAERRNDEALAALLEMGAGIGGTGLDLPPLFPWRAYASVAASALGDRDQADELADEALLAARETGVPRVVAEAHRLRARGLRGEEALAFLDRAFDALPAEPARLERIRVLVDRGAALRRLQRRSEARVMLKEGHDLAREGGARALAAVAAAELRATGGSGLASAAGDALTPSERRVAGLAAEGHSNGEIAQLLFITVKTVEYHLGNVFRKLGIKRRSQLAVVLDPEARETAGVAR